MNNVKLIVMDNITDLGNKIDLQLQKITNVKDTYIVPHKEIVFSNGEGKVIVDSSIINKDVYILCDISNYSCTYKMYNLVNHMSPNDHFQNLKRIINAIKDEVKSITVITPLLYQSRQDNHIPLESYDSVNALKELENLGVKEIITFDVHHIDIKEDINKMIISNYLPSEVVINMLLKNEDINGENIIYISPDESSLKRIDNYKKYLDGKVGYFCKRRNLNVLVNGKNPIIEHVYHGDDINNKDVIIVDDMIASGETILKTINKLKELNARKIYVICTFSLFTEGVNEFNKAYEKGTFNKVYSTNLNYCNDEICNEKWFVRVECSELIAKIINFDDKKRTQ